MLSRQGVEGVCMGRRMGHRVLPGRRIPKRRGKQRQHLLSQPPGEQAGPPFPFPSSLDTGTMEPTQHKPLPRDRPDHLREELSQPQ